MKGPEVGGVNNFCCFLFFGKPRCQAKVIAVEGFFFHFYPVAPGDSPKGLHWHGGGGDDGGRSGSHRGGGSPTFSLFGRG